MSNPALLFADVIDTATDEAMVEELYWSMIQRHPLHILDQTKTKNIYGEPTEEPSYKTVSPSIPIHIKLNPEEEELNKYGYDRTRDAIAWFSKKILEDIGLSPKVGDRIDFTFQTELGATVVEHFEIHEISLEDFARQIGYAYQVTAAMDRTHKAKMP